MCRDAYLTSCGVRYMNIRVIISTLGPLHLIKSADYLSILVDVTVIQGMLPSWWNKWMIWIASKFQKRDISKTIGKRVPPSLKGRNIGIAFPDIYYWACRFFKVGTPQSASMKAALLFGDAEKKYLKDADIFHVRSGSGAAGAIAYAKSKGMKVVVDHSIAHPAFMEHNLRAEYEKNGAIFDLGLDNPFWQEIVDECSQADALLVNSYFVRDTFIEQGYDPCKIRVAYLGVRPDFFGLKKDYALPKDRPFRILFTGGFGFRKGAEYILAALAELDRLGMSYEMVVVGDSSGARALLEKYHPANIKLVNTVPQDELKTFLSNADVYLFPSLCEGCASSGMEAMAAGLPVIATKESGLPIENRVNGVLVEARNVQQIINAILRLRDSLELREKLGREAASMISRNYTWEKYAENVVEVYKKLIQ